MAPIQPNSTVLVTGANGFIAVWIIKLLIERGFKARAAVRSAGKGDYLKDLYKDTPDKFEYVIVEDIEKEGAFNESVKGIEGVVHLATPVHFDAVDPKEIIEPAVQGTLGIVKSIKEHGPTVKRVIVTSSTVSVLEPHPEVPSYKYTEADWAYDSLKQIETQGAAAPGWIKYMASKVEAELAFWKYFDTNTGLGFDGVTILPSWTLGPLLQDVNSPKELNISVKTFYNYLKFLEENPKETSPEKLYAEVDNIVDVRDVASAQVEALLSPKAGGERFIISGYATTYQDILDAIRNSSASNLVKIPLGTPGKIAVHPSPEDGSKATRLLGFNYLPLEKTIGDLILAFKERGW